MTDDTGLALSAGLWGRLNRLSDPQLFVAITPDGGYDLELDATQQAKVLDGASSNATIASDDAKRDDAAIAALNAHLPDGDRAQDHTRETRRPA